MRKILFHHCVFRTKTGPVSHFLIPAGPRNPRSVPLALPCHPSRNLQPLTLVMPEAL